MTEFEPHTVDWTPEKVARMWDFYGSQPAFRTMYFSAHSGGRIAERVEREVGVRGKRVLDFGCGKGDLLAHLYAQGIGADGLEFSPDSARETEERFRGQPLFGGVTLTSDLPSPLASASYDVVFLVEVVEHLLDEQMAPTLGEVRRLLAPGGHVVVTTPNEEDLATEQVPCPDCGAIFHRWQHQRAFSADSLAGLVGGHGFETTVSEGVNWLAPRTLKARLLRALRPQGAPHLLYVGRAA